MGKGKERERERQQGTLVRSICEIRLGENPQKPMRCSGLLWLRWLRWLHESDLISRALYTVCSDWLSFTVLATATATATATADCDRFQCARIRQKLGVEFARVSRIN